METEYIEDGYIKLSRRVFNSKTFSSLNAIQKLITIYLILMANHQDNEWWDKYHKQFVVIKRGSFVTSIENIKKLLNDKLITTKKIRTTLEVLKKMQFLAIETASGYSRITILKYNLYQDGESYKGKQKGKARARVGQGKGKGRAINNNGNNVNNDKNEEENKERKEVQKSISASLKEKPVKEERKANDIEFDQELLSWHGVDEDIIDDWEKRFPNIDVPVELMKIREHFKNNPEKAKDIEKKFEGRMPIYINDWLERAEKYRIADDIK